MEPLQQSLGFMLNVAARQMRRQLVQQLNGFGLTATQYVTLWCLWESGEDMPISQLSKKLFFDNPTMTGIIDRMVRDGFLERIPNEEDRRVIKVRLTDKSLKLRDKVIEFGTMIDQQSAQHLDKTTYDQLLQFLNRLSQST